MLNVNQITSMLRRLQPDTALQEYAKANKDNPYIMALALSEAKRREKMKIAAQANAPEQPKVVDQAIQSMAAPMPEDIGIAQLPAGDMNFADGGIVAFDEGGPVERYQSGGQLGSAFSTFLKNTGQVSAYANGTPAQKAAIEAAFRTAVQGPFVPPAGAAPGAAPAAAAPAGAAPAASNPEGWYRRLLAGKPLPRVLSGGAALDIAGLPLVGASALTAAMQNMRDQGYTADPRGEFDLGEGTAAQLTFDEDRRRRAITAMSREDRLRKFGTADVNLAMAGGASSPAGREAAQRAQSAAPSRAAPTAADVQQFMDAGTRAASNAGTGGPRRNVGTGAPRSDAGGPELLGGPGTTAGAAGIAGLPTMQSPLQMYEAALSAVPLVDPAAGQREALGSEIVGGAERRARTLKEDIAKEGDVFAGRGERISQREAKLKDYERTNQSLSLLNAGLAVMSTPGGLATALGKGARVGTEQYAAGLDKIRAAQERIEDARDNLDALRLNRADMNRKEIRAAEADIDRAKTDAKKLGIEGLMAASDLRHKQASELFKGTLEQAKAVYAGEVDLRGRRIAADASLAAARASAGAQRNLFEALGSADPNSPLRKGYEMFKQEGQIPRLYAEYTKLASDPTNGAAFEQKYPTFEAFMASMGGARAPGFVTPPANATVLKPPGTR